MESFEAKLFILTSKVKKQDFVVEHTKGSSFAKQNVKEVVIYDNFTRGKISIWWRTR